MKEKGEKSCEAFRAGQMGRNRQPAPGELLAGKMWGTWPHCHLLPHGSALLLHTVTQVQLARDAQLRQTQPAVLQSKTAHLVSSPAQVGRKCQEMHPSTKRGSREAFTLLTECDLAATLLNVRRTQQLFFRSFLYRWYFHIKLMNT